MNLVIITSVINALPGQSVYSNEERLNQLLLKTIPSIIKFVPEHKIILLEGSELTPVQKDQLSNVGLDEIFYYPTNRIHKSYGELLLTKMYLSSNSFQGKFNDISNLIKISGRYYLTDGFDINRNLQYNVIKKDHSRNVCETRYYKVIKAGLSDYIESLDKLLMGGIELDLEHSFYQYDVVKCVTDIDRIYLAGNQAPGGDYVED